MKFVESGVLANQNTLLVLNFLGHILRKNLQIKMYKRKVCIKIILDIIKLQL